MSSSALAYVRRLPFIPVVLILALIALFSWQLPQQGGSGVLWQGLIAPGIDQPQQLLAHYVWWPRLAMALLAGAGLGIAGVLMQQLLRNPLASPTTLGVSTGANLALTMATLWAPGLLSLGREWVALVGGGLAVAIVMALSWRRSLAPIVVVLAGLVVNLYLGALSTALLLFNQDAMSGLLVWAAGSLAQNGWADTVSVSWRLALGVLAALLLLRPLRLLELDDASARSLGISVRTLRLGGLAIAVWITATLVSFVGIIGFIGLAAPNIVRLAGIRSLSSRLIGSALLGGGLLVATDWFVQSLTGLLPVIIPTGAVAGALGAPLLLWLIPKLSLTDSPPQHHLSPTTYRHPAPQRLVLVMAGSLLGLILLALFCGQDIEGWYWLKELSLLEWRWPRVIAAAASGLMLALAGTLLQRLSGNPMASPEVLGISSGCAIALLLSLFVLPSEHSLGRIAIGAGGGLLTLGLILALTRRHQFAPERMLLAGVAMGAVMDALVRMILASGDPRAQEALAWMTGSTYYVTASMALGAAGLALVMVAIVWPLQRWLDLLPLGSASSRALGVPLNQARLLLLLVVAVLTAGATLIVGPLSFVGLLAPHLARLMGLVRARWQLLGAGLLGTLLMVLADALGRQLLFPHDLPAGLVAALIGGAYFIWGLRRM
ncbi:Fe3+-hydroxamate ABC transporter permease FhuB [Terasakiispira papahanaumokuakeensis]|uniref:Fe3+-hydroxamate ABC transporter permease FhuB n=1 Tax=Terasakiispira papahanaumokuakeensis TaxID=197479 RepID=A0A1E2VCY9_9GAMM|nr:Fe(3+)-hydroxamate ABC transporter permease FhuB [Terasakiispira papahanaumokuakeensis]ODC04880.1 Fe3+-hydroxamate ABC transporter permease FhuB [Terasakiispira papahanaumokuakeensis]